MLYYNIVTWFSDYYVNNLHGIRGDKNSIRGYREKFIENVLFFRKALDVWIKILYTIKVSRTKYATVAQSVEQLIRNQQVGSSSLPSSSKKAA